MATPSAKVLAPSVLIIFPAAKDKANVGAPSALLTDDEHHIIALSVSVPGSKHDKRLSDEVATVERLPDGC